MTIESHYDGSASSYAVQYDPEKMWSSQEYPANFFRLRLVLRLLAEANVQSVYDLGCGDATPLVEIAAQGIRVAGNDLSSAMVKEARKNLGDSGLDQGLVRQLDLEDFEAVKREANERGVFDAAIALGVIPHVKDDNAFVAAMDLFIRPGGTLLLQFRNSLFSLFTFNRLTKEFVLNELLSGVSHEIRTLVAADLDKRLDITKPPIRTRKAGDGYDQILSRFHNPLALAEVIRSHGYSKLKFHWYNIHPAYPMLQDEFDQRAYRKEQVRLEGNIGWEGMFICSAGVIEATKIQEEAH